MISARGKITYFGVLFHEEVFYLKEREKKKRKLHLINSHGADIYSISLHVYLYKGNTFFLQTLWIMLFLFFLFILI